MVSASFCEHHSTAPRSFRGMLSDVLPGEENSVAAKNNLGVEDERNPLVHGDLISKKVHSSLFDYQKVGFQKRPSHGEEVGVTFDPETWSEVREGGKWKKVVVSPGCG